MPNFAITIRSSEIAAFLTILIIAAPEILLAATKNWSTSYPTSGSVTIPANDTVMMDANLNLKNLTILGKVLCTNKNLTLQSNWIMVKGGLECGNQTTPFSQKLSITLTGNNVTENINGMGTKFIGVMNGGSIQFNGTKRVGWTRLSAKAAKGETQISLGKVVDWKVGESIVISSTDYRPEHAEQVTVTKISGNRVSFSEPLKYNHWCQRETFNASAIHECAEVGLLNRNIIIQGDSNSTGAGFGGHIMVMNGSSAKLNGVELFRMGQKGLIGRYPMHWHLVGEAPGQYLANSSIHHAYNRFVSIHGTHQVQLLKNLGYETFGHGFYLEDGIEENNALIENLGLSVHNAPKGKPTASDKATSVFWISNPNNTLRNNVAAGSEDTGFWLGFPEHPIGLSTTDSIWPRRTALKEFRGNVSHSNGGRGLYVDGGELPDRTTGTTWYEPRVNPQDEKSALVTPIFNNFTAYKNRSEGVWIRSFAGPILNSAKLADNWMGAYFANILSGPKYTNIGVIQNALIVGETGNLGNPEEWERKGLNGRELPHFWLPNDSIRGVEFYDGPMTIRKSIFVNFQSNSQRKAGALSSLAPNPFWVSSLNSAETISFVNANRVYLHSPTVNNSGDAFSTFLDKDGSVSGVTGSKIVPQNPVLVTSQCTLNSAWNAYVCPHEYVNLHIFDYTGGHPSGTLIQRDDGASMKLYSADQYSNELHANLIMGRSHALQFPQGTPKHLGFVVSEKASKPIRISIPYPYTNFTATLWGSPIQQAVSLADLNVGGHKFFHDGNRLHLRLVSEQGKWEEIEIKRF